LTTIDLKVLLNETKIQPLESFTAAVMEMTSVHWTKILEVSTKEVMMARLAEILSLQRIKFNPLQTPL